MITINQIQEELAKAIKESGIKQNAIAEKLNIKPTQICSYIKGRKMPSLDTFANLCVILDLDPAEILCIK